ncbi:MAG: 1-deoxy-D-xylulose-5-phosphate synthase [Lachnospiraceae bacterium]|nr:1-deoxy-D-xylulose-5-phosphate synthase [Lachnospiraceae bacterium]
MYLEQIHQTGDIHKIDPENYPALAAEIRRFLIHAVSRHGGHLASNLGVVELTMALHTVFDPEKDRIIWDVGHQSYTHKLLTGRKKDFDNLREYKGLSGFPKRRESSCDAFDTGHSSTSISAGMGYAKARDLTGGDYNVIAVIGDGSLTGGMALEALNNVSRLGSRFIVILNDNEMSISRNIGGISDYLARLRRTEAYIDFKEKVSDSIEQIPRFGDPLHQLLSGAKKKVKDAALPTTFIERLGITYWGLVDGHNTDELISVLEAAKKLDKPVLIHVTTKKGKGYRPAEEHPDKFHGIGPFDIKTGEPIASSSGPSWTSVFSEALMEAATERKELVALTAAMPGGTGLSSFAKAYPNRFFDCCIAEQHTVTFAAGLAAGGLKPVVCVYSSFLQRAYDQIVHDVCIQNLPVVFAVDRAGLVGNDGETHQGLMDLSFLSSIPNMHVCSPKDADELKAMLKFAFGFDRPIAVRYPRGTACSSICCKETPVEDGKAEWICRADVMPSDSKNVKTVALIGVGHMTETAWKVKRLLDNDSAALCDAGSPGAACKVSLINLRFISPLDQDMLREAAGHDLIVTIEENVEKGGAGEHISSWLTSHGYHTDVIHAAVPDIFVEHGSISELRQMMGLDPQSIAEKIKNHFNQERPDS